MISLDEDDNSEQPAAEPSYFLQPLYLLSKHHILKKFFLVLRSFVKAVRKKKVHVNFRDFHVTVKRTTLDAAQPQNKIN